jgi:3-oxoacyl-[acyl-carrier protein] reductase
MDLQLSEKVALVAAASKGLGKASALALAREGASVVICSRSQLIEETAAEIRDETGARVIPVQADVRQAADVDRFVQAALDAFGQIDILVTNAGGPPPGRFMDFTASDWQAAVDLSLMSVVHMCYGVVPHMLERGSGSIVAIESITVKQPLDNLILSNAIRMAVIGMLKSMANELGRQGIRINSINPTFTYTERVEQLLTNRAQANNSTVEEEAAKIAANVPLGRMGDVAEFGRTVAWLASPAASFIHGHALMFDGGATKTPL